MPKEKLGKLLVDKNVISEDQLQRALEEQDSAGQRLGHVLIKLGYVTERELLDVLEEQLSTPKISLEDSEIDWEAAAKIPYNIAKRYKAVAVAIKGNTLEVAMQDPLNVVAVDDLQLVTGMEVKPLLATESELDDMIKNIYEENEQIDKAYRDLNESLELIPDEELTEESLEVDDAPVAKLVNSIIEQAVKERASDVHVEPQEKNSKIRFRIDGALRDYMELPKKSHPVISSRVKIMGQLDIAEKRRPQDGRISMKVNNRPLDFRISTMPTVLGEKITMRILDKENMLLGLEKLGLSDTVFENYTKVIKRPYGMVLVTGPTGSGKTTTLYSTLNKINTREKNIITIEDPVEYLLTGINQISVNQKAGLTFANGLRSMLRQDPDVIMVGEIRDYETAQIAVQSANTGHLVFSTLHTNNAAGALTRLLDMGVESYLVASSVAGVLAQRLIKVICQYCRKEYQVPPDSHERLVLGLNNNDPLTLFKGEGCKACGFTGYLGRTSVSEYIGVDFEVQKMVLKKYSAEEIREELRSKGFFDLWDDAVSKVLNGITTVEEISKLSLK